MSLKSLEDYFSSIQLPDTLRINQCTFANNLRKLVDSNIEYLKAHPGNKVYLPYYNQLVEIKKVLETLDNKNKIS